LSAFKEKVKSLKQVRDSLIVQAGEQDKVIATTMELLQEGFIRMREELEKRPGYTAGAASLVFQDEASFDSFL
jgi:hypothetical protein